MKVFLNKKNYLKVYRNLKNKKIDKLSILSEKDFFSLTESNPIFELKKIADFCIEKDIDLKIYNIPICFMLGYKRYLVFDKNQDFIKLNQCGPCQFLKECPGVIKIHHPVLEKLIKPIVRGFTDLEKCMLKILSIGNGISTERVLELAKKIKICASCTSEGEVFRVADRLIEKGFIKRDFRGGKYIWSLTKNF